MFPFEHFSNFQILIINQTQKNNLLYSDYKTVRVINSFEKGLSKSRNLGIKNAVAKIVLIADDDVEFVEGFEKVIVDEFEINKNAHLISFNNIRIGEEKPRNNSKTGYKHNFRTIKKVCSIEIAFRLNTIIKKEILFNEKFGLGSFFETGEEYLFLRTLIIKNVAAYFNPSIIVKHGILSSGENIKSDKLLYARAGLFKDIRGVFSIFWLLKYLFFLLRKKYLTPKDLYKKYKIGVAAFNKHKELTKKT